MDSSKQKALSQALTYVRLLRYSFKAPKTKFIILALGRNGSELLVKFLNCHKDIYCASEPFLHLRVGKILSPYWYIQGCSKHAVLTNKTVYGFKLKIHQLSIEQSFKRYKELLVSLHNEGWKFIHIKRENMLRQVVSVFLGRAAGRFHFIVGDNRKTPKIKIDIANFIALMQKYENYIKQENEVLQYIPALSLTYEKDLLLTKTHQQSANKVFSYLGISETSVNTNLRKMASANLEENIINYNEFYKYIANSKYAKYLHKRNDK